MGRNRSRSEDERKHRKHKDHKDKDKKKRKDKDKKKKSSKSSSKLEFLIPTLGDSKWGEAPDLSSIKDKDGKIIEDIINADPEKDAVQETLQKEQSDLFNVMIAQSKFMPKMETSATANSTNISYSTYRQRPDLMASTNGTQRVNPNVVSALGETNKIMRKIYMPKDSKFNYTGLIIGPKGSNQKRLEEETGCKILVRGKGSQKEGQAPQPDGNEDLHVLIAGDSDVQVAKAQEEIEKIISADEETRNRIRQAQLRIVAKIKNADPIAAGLGSQFDPSLTTPFGPPSEGASVIKVPKDCVGLVIGRGGDTIKDLQRKSGATRVQVAADTAPGSQYRNVFVEGSDEACQKVKAMLNEIVENQRNMHEAMSGKLKGKVRVIIKVPNNMVGLVIGRGGETIKFIAQKTGATVFMSKDPSMVNNLEKTIMCVGTKEQTGKARKEIEKLTKQKNLTLKYYEQEEDEDIPGEMDKPQYTQGGYSAPGLEKLQELHNYMTTENWFNYYNNTSTLTETEYYPDGSIKVKTETADNNLESMPDITGIMKKMLPKPKDENNPDAQEEFAYGLMSQYGTGMSLNAMPMYSNYSQDQMMGQPGYGQYTYPYQGGGYGGMHQ